MLQRHRLSNAALARSAMPEEHFRRSYILF
jgi:hypothetical protein